MPSIFIWKSEKPNNSKKNIRYYSGSNWVLEDNEYSSKSYMYLEQIVIPGSNDSVITFHTRNMPQDWIGSELLEVTCVPYELIKSDNYGVLEQIGEWMRFTSKNEVSFSYENLKKEYNQIQQWISNTSTVFTRSTSRTTPHRTQYPKTPSNLDINKIQNNFQEFLIKYTLPLSQTQTILMPTDLSNSKKTHLPKYLNNGGHSNNKYGKINNKNKSNP